VWLFLALLLVALAPALATAQDSGATHKIEAIRARMERGQALFVAGDLEAAATTFDDGYRATPYSAFLFNAGVCYQKLGQLEKALERFSEYVRVDPTAPDVAQVRERIARLEAAVAAARAEQAADAGVAGDDAGPAAEAQAPAQEEVSDRDMKSLVVIETQPPGAPLRLFLRKRPDAPPFLLGANNPDWAVVAATTSPANLTLALGHYHIVVDKFRDFNVSQTDIDVAAGRVLHFRANLSQGAFLGFLRVTANVRDASIYVDDPSKARPAWGLTPHGELVPEGEHTVLVEAPGYEPRSASVRIVHGERKELPLSLARVGYGMLRIDANAPELKVRVDDKPVGVWRSGEPPLEIKLQSGPKRLSLLSPGRKTYEGTIDVPRGQALPVHAKMVPTYPRGAAWTQAIIGGLFIGAATYFGIESNRLHSDLQEDRRAGVLEQDDSRIQRGQIYAIGADVGFAVGGVLAILATYNFIRDPLPESNRTVDRPVEFDTPNPPRTAAGRAATGRSAAWARRGGRHGRSPSPGVVPGAGMRLGGSF
jgi:hypothetical protein